MNELHTRTACVQWFFQDKEITVNKSRYERLLKCLQEDLPCKLQNVVIQRWWIVEKVVEGPESDNSFSAVVGVLRNKYPDLKRPYRQHPVIVMTEKLGSRSGVALNFGSSSSYLHYLKLSPIDFNYSIFPDWD